MKLYTHAQIVNEFIGKKGTHRRNAFDAKLKAEIEAYQIGATIRQRQQKGQPNFDKMQNMPYLNFDK